ncbi:MAG: cell division topological specificity factor MinE [Lachnospiraceae bacterium]|nr:cell division topological specificity factor MinE [Lachnospiraceae bacterium]
MWFMKKKSSGDVAKNRLKLVLSSDKAGCSPEIMEQMKNEIIEVISKYIDVDTEGLEFKFRNASDGSNSLLANIPIKEAKGRRRY